jgi:hypothetical protein
MRASPRSSASRANCKLDRGPRASNVTRANWEGAGVQPDRMVPTTLERHQPLAQAALKPKDKLYPDTNRRRGSVLDLP